MRAVFLLVRKEFLQVLRDRTTIAQVFLIPVIQLLVLSNAATFDVPRARLAVADADGSPLAASLVERLEGGGRFRVVRAQPTPGGFEAALRGRAVSGVLHVPAGFARSMGRERRDTLQLELDAQDGATAGILLAAAQGILADWGREALPGGAPAPGARLAPLDARPRGWYNPSRDYRHYMVPGILVSLVSIIGLLLTAQNIAREKELGTLEQLNVTPLTKGQFIAGKLIPYWLLALATFCLGLAVGRLAFGIPMRGSVPLVIACAMVYLVGALGVGLWLSTFAETQQQAMFLSFFVLLLYLLLSGIFTPVDAMPPWARALAQLNPVKHFVVIMRTVLVRGGGPAAIWREVATLAVFGAGMLALAVAQHRKRTG